jgi:hypothetical protein
MIEVYTANFFSHHRSDRNRRSANHVETTATTTAVNNDMNSVPQAGTFTRLQ